MAVDHRVTKRATTSAELVGFGFVPACAGTGVFHRTIMNCKRSFLLLRWLPENSLQCHFDCVSGCENRNHGDPLQSSFCSLWSSEISSSCGSRIVQVGCASTKFVVADAPPTTPSEVE